MELFFGEIGVGGSKSLIQLIFIESYGYFHGYFIIERFFNCRFYFFQSDHIKYGIFLISSN